MPAIGAALGVAALILVWRLVRRESAQPAISGFIGVGISALIAYLVGESKGYFLLGIWIVAVLGRRLPVVGADPPARRRLHLGLGQRPRPRLARVRRAVLAFDIATFVWVLVFASRFVVQHHLYDADQTGWLGVARIAMGWPLTAVAALVTYLAIRAAQRALHAHDAEEIRKRPPRNTEAWLNRMPIEADGRRRRRDTTGRSIAVAVLASFVAFLDGSVVNLALPAIGREFGGGLALQQWVVDGYLLTLGALILVAGAISDQFGRLSVLRMGVVVFAVASVLCALAPSGWVLVAARCLQGIGAAFLVPSSLAMINARFSGAAQARAIGTWTAWTGTAFVVGPLLGGVLVDALNWRWIFGVNIVPLAVTLYLTTKLSAGEFGAEPVAPRSMSSARC